MNYFTIYGNPKQYDTLFYGGGRGANPGGSDVVARHPSVWTAGDANILSLSSPDECPEGLRVRC